MTQSHDSYRQILRSSFLVGGAMVFNVLIGLARSKAAALLLGPAGVGLIGLFQSIVNFGAVIAGLGLRTVGTRQVADAVGRDDASAIGAVRRALLWGTVGLAGIGAITCWLLRGMIADHILRDTSLTTDVGLLGIGIALTVAAGSQAALLAGLRRVGDVARVSLWSSFAATVIGCAILAAWRERGVVAFVLVAPAATFLAGHWRIAKLKLAIPPPTSLPQLGRQWATMARLGIAFMASTLVSGGSEFYVRVLVERHLGAAALGHFYAAWTISATYVGLVLTAIGFDYYPRLTAVVADRDAAKRLVNEQTEVVLLLAAPVLLAIIGLAPFVTQLLYSREFAAAAGVLRWQALGDVVLVVIWPLGYLLLARGQGVIYFLSEAIPLAVFMLATTLLLPVFGIQATGGAFLLMNILHLVFALWLAWWRSGWLPWRREVTGHFFALVGLALLVFMAAEWSNALGAVLGTMLAGAAGVYALIRFSRMVGTAVPPRVAAVMGRMKGAFGGQR